ncbi:N5-glutamine methyltransferase family protein, partial [Thermodesulfobacteriota bacterium]
LPAVSVTAVDLSYRALQVAQHNAKRHEVDGRVAFINSDWLGGISTETKYDLVVANPPYIAKEIIDRPFGETAESLQPEVGSFEPRLALDGGVRGVQSICSIAEHIGEAINPGGLFFMEIGADQKEEVTDIFMKTGQFYAIEIHDDYAGLPRLFQARRQ